MTVGESHSWENNSADVSYAINRAPGQLDNVNEKGQILKTLFLTSSKYLLKFVASPKWTMFSSGDSYPSSDLLELSSNAELFYATRLNDNVFYSMTTQLSDNQLKALSPRFTIFYGGQGNNTTTKLIDLIF